MAEVRLALQAGGLVVVSFSDCCWAERATAGWLARSSGERLELVARYGLLGMDGACTAS